MGCFPGMRECHCNGLWGTAMIAQAVGPRRLTFTIPGRLGSWNRAGRNTAKGITYTPAKMRSDQGIIKHFAVMAMREGCGSQLVGPLRMVVNTWRAPPHSWGLKKRAAAKWITGKPDFDNTLKLVCDALSNVAYRDDAQIASGHHLKRYRVVGPECVEIEIEELGE